MSSRQSPHGFRFYSSSGIGLTALALVSVLGFLLIKRSNAQQVTVKKLETPLVTEVGEGTGRGFSLKVFTVTHDQHRYVVTNAGGIVHSHNCPCTR